MLNFLGCHAAHSTNTPTRKQKKRLQIMILHVNNNNFGRCVEIIIKLSLVWI